MTRRVNTIRNFNATRTVAGASLALATTLLLASCGTTTSEAVTVNGQGMSSDDIEQEFHDQEANRAYVKAAGEQGGFGKSGKLTAAGKAAWIQNQIIVQTLVDQEFEKRKLKITAKDRKDAITNYEQQLVDPTTRKSFFHSFSKRFQDLVVTRTARRQVLARALEKPVSAAAVEAEYNKNYRCVSHILVKTEAEAKAIESDLAGGGDFATIAKEKSTDTGSGAKGGDLGCAPTSQYVEEFANAAKAATPGVATTPVKSQFGWHILLVRKKPPLSAALRTQISTELRGNSNPLEGLLTKAVKGAKVRIDPKLGVWIIKTTADQPLPHLEPPGAKTAVTVTTDAPAPNERPTSP